MIGPVEPDLKQLPKPSPPITFAATVMARVSRVADEPALAASTAATPRSRPELTVLWKDVAAALALFSGLAVVFVSWIDGGLYPAWWRDLVSAQAMPTPASTSSSLFGLAVGLLIYATGLLGRVRNTAGPRASPPPLVDGGQRD